MLDLLEKALDAPFENQDGALVGQGWVASDEGDALAITVFTDNLDLAKEVIEGRPVEGCELVRFYKSKGLGKYRADCGAVIWSEGVPGYCQSCGKRVI